MPNKAQRLWEQLGGAGSVHAQRLDSLRQLDASGWTVRKGDGLFPRPVSDAPKS
jgi:methionyl-tRNA synthetase